MNTPIPKPGPPRSAPVDPESVRARVTELVQQARAVEAASPGDTVTRMVAGRAFTEPVAPETIAGTIGRRADLLEQAHDVLVEALESASSGRSADPGAVSGSAPRPGEH